MSLGRHNDGQFDLISDFEATGLAKPAEKQRVPRKTIADKMIDEMYKKVAEAEKVQSEKKKVTNSVSIKGLIDEIHALKPEDNIENKDKE
ncbi:MAG: hypothetical protein WCN88_00280 [Candidatus Falkowbacteria bacterium]